MAYYHSNMISTPAMKAARTGCGLFSLCDQKSYCHGDGASFEIDSVSLSQLILSYGHTNKDLDHGDLKYFKARCPHLVVQEVSCKPEIL